MRKLSKITVLALAAATVAGTALPAQAQPYPGHRYDRHEDPYDRYDRDDRGWQGNHARGIWNQIEELQRQIERSDSRDRISEREAAGLRRDVWRLRQQFRDYSRDGLSGREARVLQERIDQIRYRLRSERRDWDGRRW
jgi:Spy/CpxP family protein refolding chaperone